MSRDEEQAESILARVDALSHELRLTIAMVLSQYPATASEVAREIGVPADKVRYQLRKLLDAGLLEVSRERKRRGVVERVYVARERQLFIDADEILAVSAAKRAKFAVQILKASFRASLRALADGTIVDRERTLVTWTPMRLDIQGWDELTRLHFDTLAQMQAIKAESAERQQKTAGPSISASSVLLWFENPKPGA